MADLMSKEKVLGESFLRALPIRSVHANGKETNTDHEIDRVMVLVTLRECHEGEELFVDYGIDNSPTTSLSSIPKPPEEIDSEPEGARRGAEATRGSEAATGERGPSEEEARGAEATRGAEAETQGSSALRRVRGDEAVCMGLEDLRHTGDAIGGREGRRRQQDPLLRLDLLSTSHCAKKPRQLIGLARCSAQMAEQSDSGFRQFTGGACDEPSCYSF